MKGLALLVFGLGAICVEAYIVNPGPKYVATKGAVWPKPQQQELFETFFTINTSAFKFVVDSSTCNILYNAVRRYEEIISNQRLSRLKTKQSKPVVAAPDDDDRYLGQIVQVQINLNEVCDDTSYPAFQVDESYSLTVASEGSTITARTVWGVLRGLETFSQLLYTAEDGSSTRVNATKIQDFPRFPVRGLLLDTSRHFIHLAQIYQLLDAMAYNKLNVFHWHIVDDQSFPYVSMKFPELSQAGAYDSVELVYAPDDIKAVIEYARQRGIRVIPEFDTPGHTRSWGVSHPELLTACDDIQKGSFGPIDPSKASTYSFIEELFSELRALFIDPFIHLGGDEVDFDCWELDDSITSFMNRENIRNYSQLEGYYIQKVIDIADDLSFNSIVWEEVFSNGVNLPNGTIVHVWRDWEGSNWNDTMRSVTKAGKMALLSACWYLDHLSNGGDWQKFYQCEPTNFGGTPEQVSLLLGGEACMWAEVVNDYNVVQRIFPRASAPAEKLWSAYDPAEPDLDEIARRLEEHVCRMNARGIPAQPPTAAGFCL